jgi:conjugal transfer mating pair stabilization protein TraN
MTRPLAALAIAMAATLVGITSAAHAADCQKLSDLCVEGPQTRTISGHPVYRDCWRTRAQYSCVSQNSVDDCQPLRDRGCSQVGSRCVETGDNGTCLLHEQAFQCRVADGATSTITHCGTQRFCLDGRCFDTGHPPDADFARAVAGLEAQREAGQYLDPTTLTVFRGHDTRCRKKLFGLVNCCEGAGSDTSLFSNMSLVRGAGGQALGAAGSSYTYDALFTSEAPDMLIGGFEALFGVGGGSSALAGVLAGELSVELFVQAMMPGPWTLAILAIQLSGLLECEQAEQILAMKRDNRLCHSIGSYCSKRVPVLRTCIETTQSHCCFNSRLARILNEQGRVQLGKVWGSPDAPDCSGFTLPQLQALDFSRMNFTEFYVEIAPTLPDTPAIQQKARQRLNDYFGQ